MLGHVREAERAYARKLGVALAPRTPWEEQRALIEAAVRDGVERPTGGCATASGGSAGTCSTTPGRCATAPTLAVIMHARPPHRP